MLSHTCLANINWPCQKPVWLMQPSCVTTYTVSFHVTPNNIVKPHPRSCPPQFLTQTLSQHCQLPAMTQVLVSHVNDNVTHHDSGWQCHKTSRQHPSISTHSYTGFSSELRHPRSARHQFINLSESNYSSSHHLWAPSSAGKLLILLYITKYRPTQVAYWCALTVSI